MLNVTRVVSYAVLVGVKRVLSRNLVGSWDDSDEVLEGGKVFLGNFKRVVQRL